MTQIRTRDASGRDFLRDIQGEPDRCPICHQGIQPIDSKWDFLAGDLIERVFICPLQRCQHLFIARYERNPNSGIFFLRRSVPTELRDYEFSPELKQLSPDFCSIYGEAHKAEQLGLLLVCGPGYRKALEFLIKDYVSVLNSTPEAMQEIEELPLMACIKKYVADANVIKSAERATWLGNDQTHYVRKWEDKDLQDLKKLIQVACYWIQADQLTRGAVEDMPQGKK